MDSSTRDDVEEQIISPYLRLIGSDFNGLFNTHGNRELVICRLPYSGSESIHLPPPDIEIAARMGDMPEAPSTSVPCAHSSTLTSQLNAAVPAKICDLGNMGLC
jgi:hypothetical protein